MGDPCIVLVTGGSGCLGQHVIGLLQSRAPHVTEIRVLDIVKYTNKLDYIERVPVRSFVGGVNDEHLLGEAFQGVVCVIHLAAIADTTLYPDPKRTHKINVEGTASLLKIAQETTSVRRFIFCSSTSICMGVSNGSFNKTEETPMPDKRIFDPYAISKYRAEQLVIKTNGRRLKTVSLRPITLYGELDEMFVSQTLRTAGKMHGVLVPLRCAGVVHQHAYVGNVAWGFVCAENKFQDEEKRHSATNRVKEETLDSSVYEDFSSIENDRSSDSRSIVQDTSDISGQVYNLTDDTEHENLFQFQKHFLESCGYKLASFACPVIVIYVILWVIYYLFKFFNMLGFKLNLSNGFQSITYVTQSHTFSGDKARRELGYRPIYTVQDSMERARVYYQKQYGRHSK